MKVQEELNQLSDKLAKNHAKLKASDLIQLLDGRITISKVTCNKKDDYISVEIVFDKKRIVGQITLEDYARMITGQARMPIKIESV